MVTSTDPEAIESETDFEKWVRCVHSEARLYHQGSYNSRNVAQTVVQAIETTGGDTAILMNGEPYTDKRIDPSTVLKNCSDGHFFTTKDDNHVRALPDDWRMAAIEIVERELDRVAAEEAAGRAEAEHERRLEQRRERYFDRNGHF